MLTPERLAQRLKDWREAFTASVPRIAPEQPCPILLYQALFALAHDLKTSVQMSEDPAIKALVETVLAADAALAPLAHDRAELDAFTNARLQKLAGELEDLSKLAATLEPMVAAAASVAETSPEALKKPFSWDALARARARSCGRHGYAFFSRAYESALTELPARDETIAREVRERGGVVVARKLGPSPSSSVPSSAPRSELKLEVVVLAAFPPGQAPSDEWNR